MLRCAARIVSVLALAEACSMPSYGFVAAEPADGAVPAVDSGVAAADADAGDEDRAAPDASGGDRDAAPACEGAVVSVGGRPHCFFFTKQPVLCLTACPAPAHLATTTTRAEHDAVVAAVAGRAPEPLFFIGLVARTVTTEKNDFEWVTGQKQQLAEIDLWNIGRPNGSGRCTVLRLDRSPNVWDDRAESDPRYALCERDP